MTSRARAPRTPASVPSAGRPSQASTAVAALLVPGAGHALHGQAQKAVVFACVLIFMFVAGLGFGGRLFDLQFGDPLVFLAAVAEWGTLLPRGLAALAGAGRGDVVAATYEYGNAFLIAGGLLNVLVALDAMDLASGRKAR